MIVTAKPFSLFAKLDHQKRCRAPLGANEFDLHFGLLSREKSS